MCEKKNAAFTERMKLLEDIISCARTTRVMAAPFYTYLPILLYKETTIKEWGYTGIWHQG